jgi:hypothetical protein
LALPLKSSVTKRSSASWIASALCEPPPMDVDLTGETQKPIVAETR